MAARVVRNPAGWSESLPDGAVHEARGTRQLYDVTGKVQRARLIIAVQKRNVRVAALDAHFKFKKELIRKEKQASLSGKQDSRGRGGKSPVSGNRITTS